MNTIEFTNEELEIIIISLRIYETHMRESANVLHEDIFSKIEKDLSTFVDYLCDAHDICTSNKQCIVDVTDAQIKYMLIALTSYRFIINRFISDSMQLMGIIGVYYTAKHKIESLLSKSEK
jgi:ASC-1-like (ASCH) protein